MFDTPQVTNFYLHNQRRNPSQQNTQNSDYKGAIYSKNKPHKYRSVDISQPNFLQSPLHQNQHQHQNQQQQQFYDNRQNYQQLQYQQQLPPQLLHQQLSPLNTLPLQQQQPHQQQFITDHIQTPKKHLQFDLQQTLQSPPPLQNQQHQNLSPCQQLQQQFAPHLQQQQQKPALQQLISPPSQQQQPIQQLQQQQQFPTNLPQQPILNQQQQQQQQLLSPIPQPIQQQLQNQPQPYQQPIQNLQPLPLPLIPLQQYQQQQQQQPNQPQTLIQEPQHQQQPILPIQQQQQQQPIIQPQIQQQIQQFQPQILQQHPQPAINIEDQGYNPPSQQQLNNNFDKIEQKYTNPNQLVSIIDEQPSIQIQQQQQQQQSFEIEEPQNNISQQQDYQQQQLQQQQDYQFHRIPQKQDYLRLPNDPPQYQQNNQKKQFKFRANVNTKYKKNQEDQIQEKQKEQFPTKNTAKVDVLPISNSPVQEPSIQNMKQSKHHTLKQSSTPRQQLQLQQNNPVQKLQKSKQQQYQPIFNSTASNTQNNNFLNNSASFGGTFNNNNNNINNSNIEQNYFVMPSKNPLQQQQQQQQKPRQQSQQNIPNNNNIQPIQQQQQNNINNNKSSYLDNIEKEKQHFLQKTKKHSQSQDSLFQNFKYQPQPQQQQQQQYQQQQDLQPTIKQYPNNQRHFDYQVQDLINYNQPQPLDFKQAQQNLNKWISPQKTLQKNDNNNTNNNNNPNSNNLLVQHLNNKKQHEQQYQQYQQQQQSNQQSQQSFFSPSATQQISKKDIGSYLQNLPSFKNDTDEELLLFARYLAELIGIEQELDQAKQDLTITNQISIQSLYNIFDNKQKGQISQGDFINGLQSFEIFLQKNESNHIFKRFAKYDRNLQFLSFTEFTEIFTPKTGNYKLWDVNSKNIPQNILIDKAKPQMKLIFEKLMDEERSTNTFKTLLNPLKQPDEQYHKLLYIFQHLDTHKKGYITKQDLLYFLNSFDGNFQEYQLFNIVTKFTTLNSARINFQEFQEEFQDEELQKKQQQSQKNKNPFDKKQKLENEDLLKQNKQSFQNQFINQDDQAEEPQFPGFSKYTLNKRNFKKDNNLLSVN